MLSQPVHILHAASKRSHTGTILVILPRFFAVAMLFPQHFSWPVDMSVTKIDNLETCPFPHAWADVDDQDPEGLLLAQVQQGQCRGWVNVYEAPWYYLLDALSYENTWMALVFDVLAQRCEMHVFFVAPEEAEVLA